MVPNNLLAQVGHDLGGSLEGIGPLGQVGNLDTAVTLFNRILSNIIGVLTIGAGLWFIFQFMTGAIEWISASGDKAQTEKARKRITDGIIGLVVVVAAVFLIDIIGNMLGLKILQPGEFIQGIWLRR